MKTLFQLSVLIFLLTLSATPCLAMIEIADVSPARAKELGMEIRSQPSGPDAVRIELEFPTNGELKQFSRVNLEIGDGKKLLLTCSLVPEKDAKSGRVLVNFTADRAQLDKIALMVIVGELDGRIGYLIKPKEFVELTKLRSIFEF